MLFTRSNGLALAPNEGERLRLLDALAARGLTPLARSARRRRFELLVENFGDAPRAESAARQLESACAAERERAGDVYTPGEIFCAADCVLFLVFHATAADGLTAGIIYSISTAEPLLKLDRFCRDVRESLIAVSDAEAADATGEALAVVPCWKARASSSPQGLARFVASRPPDFAAAAKVRGGARSLVRASELLEDDSARTFLRRVQEMRREGYSPRRLFAEADAMGGRATVERMLDAGLLERELRVSCRKSGHALFDLPTADSLAAITISKAKCSLCAAPVADEVVEETISPTQLAVSLLEDGGWLANRVYKIVRSLGVPDSEIATGPASAHGESYMAADVCGTSFLFVTREGDLTPAFSRRVAETVTETETTHLVAVTTGAVEDEGRLRLYEFAWRRARDGRDLGITIVEGLSGARAQIERAFETAVRRELALRLSPLDAALGFGASDFVLDWFRLAPAPGAASRHANTLTPVFPELDQRLVS
jgi:hypothetical protein